MTPIIGDAPFGGNTQNQNSTNQESKRVMAGILVILLGSLGIHKFILGYTKEGIIQLVISFISCGFLGLIGLIEEIIYLTKSDEEIHRNLSR